MTSPFQALVALLAVFLFPAVLPCRAGTDEMLKSNLMVRVTSPAFEEGASIPVCHTADGANVSPPLRIQQGMMVLTTQSRALIMDDPDAPGGPWTHWLIWNIPLTAHEIAENRLPEGAVTGINDFQKKGYSGPAPPSGVHRYFFRVYALDTFLDLPEGSRRADLEKAMRGHILNEGQLMGRYSRSK